MADTTVASDVIKLYHELVEGAYENTRTVIVDKSLDNDISVIIDTYNNYRDRQVDVSFHFLINGKKVDFTESINKRPGNSKEKFVELFKQKVGEVIHKLVYDEIKFNSKVLEGLQ